MGNTLGTQTRQVLPPAQEPHPGLAYDDFLRIEEAWQPNPQRPRRPRGAWSPRTFYIRRISQAAPARRSRRPCRFFARGNCKKGDACSFSHDLFDEDGGEQDGKGFHNDDSAYEWTRELGGASAEFGDGAAIKEIFLSSDYSAIRIDSIPRDYSVSSVLKLLAEVNLSVTADDIRLIKPSNSGIATATVKVRDPAFAKTACYRLRTSVNAVHFNVYSVPVLIPRTSDFDRVQSRHVRCSWYRMIRTACLEYGNWATAARVHQRFAVGHYLVRGNRVKSDFPVLQRRNRRDIWMVKLTRLAETVEEEDITRAIPPFDEPGQVKLEEPIYSADLETNPTLIRSMLEGFGALERWDTMDNLSGGTNIARVAFVEESQAMAAVSSLNETPLPFCPLSKLFIHLISSVKFNVPNRVYNVIRGRINSQRAFWDMHSIHFFNFSPRGSHRVLMLQGEDRKRVARAQRGLEAIIKGQAMTKGGKNVWHADFKDRYAYRAVKSIEDDMGVVIIRDARSSQFRIFGPEKQFAPATRVLNQLIQDMAVSARVAPGDQAEARDEAQNLETVCTICFCEAEEPIRTLCGHVYCGLCFVNMCQAEGSKPGEFCIACLGGSGTCGKVLNLLEIHDRVVAKTFDSILKSSFSSYIRRHPGEFRYCPTPDCDSIYRVTSDSIVLPKKFTCGKCRLSTCTSCHASHPDKTCAEHKGDASGGLEELLRAKERLGVQDCPKCSTSIEKIHGCDHMLCTRCGIHICWICLRTFKEREPCYEHLDKLHGNIGF
ncbi:hypothetical protein FZEAL_7654 [Fusarium zealandicum]|uniref:RING-type E3 ubiquitin transferase n=1 Tax=Fusarium zealandicum TaxID=1053134 RepID=A0A8H4UG44_9HYPO|nr:hypothetical protein FZEAL_7654 [Fusarium zealandicum]